MNRFLLIIQWLLAFALIGVIAWMMRINTHAISVYYVAQSAQGSGNGSTAGNADSITGSYFTSAGNWIPGQQFELVGTITTPINILANGTPSSPIILQWYSGAQMSAPVWTGGGDLSCAIYGASFNNVVIDGNNQGGIIATDSGDELDNDGCSGIAFNGVSNVVIKNLTIANLFVRHANSANTSGGGNAIAFAGNNGGGPMTGDIISNCLLHDAYSGITYVFNAQSTNFLVVQTTVSNVNWSCYVSDAGTGAFNNGFLGYSNYFSQWGNWDDPADTWHHDGYFPVANSGIASNIVTHSDILGPGYGGHMTAAFYGNGNVYGTIQIYDTLILENDGTLPNDGGINLGLGAGSYTCTGAIFNSTFIGTGATGVGIEWDGGVSTPNVTPLMLVSNCLFNGIGTPLAGFNNTYVGRYMDYNRYYGFNPSEAFCLSSSPSAVFYPWGGSGGWTNTFHQDLHSGTNQFSLAANFQPTSAIPGVNNAVAGYTVDAAGNSWSANGWGIGFLLPAGLPPAPNGTLMIGGIGPLVSGKPNGGIITP